MRAFCKKMFILGTLISILLVTTFYFVPVSHCQQSTVAEQKKNASRISLDSFIYQDIADHDEDDDEWEA